MFGLFKRKPPQFEAAHNAEGTVFLNSGPLQQYPKSSASFVGKHTIKLSIIDTLTILVTAKMFGWVGADGLFKQAPSGRTDMILKDQQVVTGSEATDLARTVEAILAQIDDKDHPFALAHKKIIALAKVGGFVIRLA